MKSKYLKVLYPLFMAFLIGGISTVFGQNLQDLVGMRASSAEYELEERGFRHQNTNKAGDGIYANWWKSSNKKCITVRTVDGRIKSVIKTLPYDCGKNSNNYGNNNNKGNSYSRGYNDGYNNRAYSPTGSSEQERQYEKGYVAGKEARRNGNYNGNNYNRPSPKHIRDLEGWNEKEAYRDIKSRGYIKIKQFYNDGKLVKVWWNERQQKCRKTAAKNEKIVNVAESTKCNMK